MHFSNYGQRPWSLPMIVVDIYVTAGRPESKGCRRNRANSGRDDGIRKIPSLVVITLKYRITVLSVPRRFVSGHEISSGPSRDDRLII